MKEEPGSDSGCTAVIALLKGRELYVANAGDSRCIVCRNGKCYSFFCKEYIVKFVNIKFYSR